MTDSQDLQEKVKEFIRAFGLHRTDQTPCGVQIAVSDAHALTEIAAHPFITQRELSECLYLQKSSVSRLVDKLEMSGWVVRQRSEFDRRVTTLVLTQRGQLLADQITAARANKFADVLSRIPPSEREHVISSLDTLIEAVSGSAEDIHASLANADDNAHRSVVAGELHKRRI
jgi:DNA-binding MarR family transcriptional regulator